MVLIRSLILSVSVAALAVFSSAAPTPSVSFLATTESSPSVGSEPSPSPNVDPVPPTTDPVPDPIPDPVPDPVPGNATDACGVLGGISSADLKYQHVVDCYNAIPFNNAQAATTLETMITLFRDFYVFTDAALAREVPSPFHSAPHDVLGELEKVGRTKYTSDYKFHNDIYNAINGLGDGHAAYSPSCYQAYAFAQKLALYAPVSVRVYTDVGKRGYNDCIVNTINGEDALSYLHTYARDSYGTSHDLNARLNFMLASQSFDKDSNRYTNSPGDFAQRLTVPDTPYIDYQLTCSNSTEPIELREEWLILPLTEAKFEDTTSYVSNVCLASAEPASADPAEAYHTLSKYKPYVRPIIKRTDPEPSPPSDGPQFPGADILVAGNATVFYHLKDRPDTGVLVCHTFLPGDDSAEAKTIISGLKAFQDLNVTNIIIDFQGNGGGSIALSAFFVQAIFPNEHPLDAAFPSDLRVSKSIEELAAVSYNKSDYGYFNAHDFVDFNSGNGTEQFQNNDLFTKPVTLTRNGRSNLWTEKTTIYFPPLPAEATDPISTFPWTGKANNIRILTDGRCGSACGMASYFYTDRHQVEAYAIGGTNGEDLSMFSFAGASVMKFEDLQSFYKAANVTSPMANLPYKTDVTVSWLEMYGKGRTTPLEYDAELYRPKHRLAFTPENARSREVLWKEVAAHAWK
ncbi:hypothetical protein FBU30_007335 [Linnemannia zychae]|nr:hypothetical protein FBU30_007335 [Linnemannia zychae]